MSAEAWQITWFTLGVAALSTLLNLPLGVGLGWLLARRNWRGKSLVETLVALPLVMPPVATGLLLLKLFGRRGPLGGWFAVHPNWEIVFTWKAVVIATAVMSFPLLARAARVAFEGVNPRLEQVARTLGAGPLRVFGTITLPLAARGLVAGTVLAFARALGEFGATIMVAGYIPGQTATLALSIYHLVQLNRDGDALHLLGVAVAIAFAAVWFGEWFLREASRMSIELTGLRLPLASFALELDTVLEAPMTAIFGASGSGKTSLLEVIAGLRRPAVGRVRLGEQLLTDTAAGLFVPPQQRAIGYVPQDGALFPHLSVRANLLYGANSTRPHPPGLNFAHVTEVLEIAALVERAPATLSAGEKQRVALGRALLAAPRLLLLDEPLAGLDLPLRERLLPYLLRVRDEFALPMLYVTHSPDEVMALCPEVLVLERGRVVRHGRSTDVFALAKNPRYELRTTDS